MINEKKFDLKSFQPELLMQGFTRENLNGIINHETQKALSGSLDSLFPFEKV